MLGFSGALRLGVPITGEAKGWEPLKRQCHPEVRLLHGRGTVLVSFTKISFDLSAPSADIWYTDFCLHVHNILTFLLSILQQSYKINFKFCN